MLAAFLDREPDRLIAVFAAYHRRLQSLIEALPRDIGLFAD
jgi:hypothetical protein